MYIFFFLGKHMHMGDKSHTSLEGELENKLKFVIF